MEVVVFRVANMIEVICIVLMIIVELLFRLIVVISIATKISRTMAPLPFLLISPAPLIYQHDEIFQFLFHQTNDPILSVNLFIQLLHLILVPLLHALHFGFIMSRQFDELLLCKLKEIRKLLACYLLGCLVGGLIFIWGVCGILVGV